MVVKPVLAYDLPQRRHQTSWRSWGGVQTEDDVAKEMARIRGELKTLEAEADFPVTFLPLAGVQRGADLDKISDLAAADVYIVYAAGGWMDVLDKLNKTGKDMIIFCRHKSGPVYLWYEIISPRFLRQHTDTLAVKGVDDADVVVDRMDEVMWRLRALCGLRNTMGTRMLAIGGPDAWAQPKDVVPELVRKTWQFDIQTVTYEDLGKLIKAARADKAAVDSARGMAAAYLKDAGVTLETQKPCVENCFLLDQVFRGLMTKAGCSAITINGCMGTIMPMAETSACLTLTLLNDAGYLAFCESDFVVIPSGVLLANIAGKPVFLNDPTYPHDGIITLAHCTAPRKMDGKTLEPTRIMTHFESDYGAAPKVEMRKGQLVTNIVPDFAVKRWVGLLGEIIDAPFMDVCRSQIDIRFDCDSLALAERMPGFHWMTCYGDYMKEIGYAIKRLNIDWEMIPKTV
ncbi:MAG: sugar isomerase [Phycisphaerae bacterium]|nr:sugar isomerase [Phycisphaerae bacterium]